MNRRLTILIAEDNPNEAQLLQLAFKKAQITNPIQFVTDGHEALQYLSGAERFADRHQFPHPSVILLDLSMPKLTGFDVLAWMREHPTHAIRPTIVFTNSILEDDIRRAYELGANSYIVKPTDLTDLVKLLRTLYEFWALSEKPAINTESAAT